MGTNFTNNNYNAEDYYKKYQFFIEEKHFLNTNKNYCNTINNKTKNLGDYIQDFYKNFDNLFASIVFLIRLNKIKSCEYLCLKKEYKQKYEKMTDKELKNSINNSFKNCMEVYLSKGIINQSILSRIEINQYINFSKRFYCPNIKLIFFNFDCLLYTIKNNYDNKIENEIKKFNQIFDKLFASFIYFLKKKGKCSIDKFYLCDNQRYLVYEKMNLEDLINSINDSLKQCQNHLKILLNSQNYTKNLLFTDREISQYIRTLKLINQNQTDNSLFYKGILNIFLKIREKNEKLDNHNKNRNNNGKPNINIKLGNKKIHDDYNNTQLNKQTQILLDKQKAIQAQDLELLNDNFGRALSSLECYANRLSGKSLSNMFDYYNMFNLSSTQKLDDLHKKAFIQTQIFQLSYEDYVKNYKQYDPPDNINLKVINELLTKWMNNVKDKDKFIYQGMINIISSLDNSFFKEQFYLLSQKYKNAKMDPKKISSFAPGICYYNQQRCHEAKKNYMEKGKIVSYIKINHNYSDDNNAEDLQKSIEINLNNYEKEKEFYDLK